MLSTILLAASLVGTPEADIERALRASPLSVEEKASHALLRLGFGPKPGEVAKLAAGKDHAIAQLVAERLRPPPADRKDDRPDLLSRPTADLARSHGADGMDGKPRGILQELTVHRIVTAASSNYPFEELAADFWLDHFNVDWKKGPVKWLLPAYEHDTIRPRIFGHFRALLGAVAHDPAMLVYLDNWLSVKDGFTPKKDNPKAPRGINENYARELLELHTLGVDGGYSQADVIAVARVFTGWTVDRPGKGGGFFFRARAHDEGEKIVLGQRFPADATSGPDEGERVLDMLAAHPATAHHIALELCQRFVRDDPSPQLVDRVAKVFRDSDGDLSATYLAVFTSSEAWSRESYRAKVKTPFFMAVSALRATGATIDRDEDAIGRRLVPLGQPLYLCQPPTGYSDLASAWVNPGALVARIRFALDLASSRIPGTNIDLEPWSGTGTIDERVDQLGRRALGVPLSPATKGAIVAEMQGEDTIDVARALGLVLGSPDFQRR